MKRLMIALVLSMGTSACIFGMGGGDVSITAVAFRAGPDTDAGAAAAVLTDAGADAALVAGPADSAWFGAVAEATGLTASGPASVQELGLGFLADEPVGDTTIELPLPDGSLTVHDALYEMNDDRLLDLLAFRVGSPGQARPAVQALLEYMATDVSNSAAVVMAVVVPSAAAGDSVGRMLRPAYFDALRCEPGLAPAEDRAGVRLFYGPEARAYCRAASAGTVPAGDVVRADLVLGRR